MLNRDFTSAIKQMPAIMSRLASCELIPLSPRKGFPKAPGVYVIYRFDTPIYVGRSKNIWQRIGNHIGGHADQSSFAFKLAREATGKMATYKPKGSRRELMQDESFKEAFATEVAQIRSLQGRFVVIADDVLQHLFEVYAALTLKTPHNQFKTS